MNWSFDEGTKEWCFEGHHVHGYYVDSYYQSDDDGKVEVSIFAINAEGHPVAYTAEITLDPKVTDALIEDIEENPENYYLQSYLDYKGDTVYTLCRYLENMPFDKNGIHATGSEYLESNGDWVTEYEDDIPDDYTPKYVYFAN